LSWRSPTWWSGTRACEPCSRWWTGSPPSVCWHRDRCHCTATSPQGEARATVQSLTVTSSSGVRDAVAGERVAVASPESLGPGEHVLVMVFHHIATDGWSSRVFARDLGLAYEARLAGGAPGWAPLPVQYVDYALWQREILARRTIRVVGEPAAGVLARRPGRSADGAGPPDGSAATCVGFPARRRAGGRSQRELHARLAELARSTGTTLSMIAQARWPPCYAARRPAPISVGGAVAGRTTQRSTTWSASS